jgi:hypothetical protein
MATDGTVAASADLAKKHRRVIGTVAEANMRTPFKCLMQSVASFANDVPARHIGRRPVSHGECIEVRISFLPTGEIC